MHNLADHPCCPNTTSFRPCPQPIKWRSDQKAGLVPATSTADRVEQNASGATVANVEAKAQPTNNASTVTKSSKTAAPSHGFGSRIAKAIRKGTSMRKVKGKVAPVSKIGEAVAESVGCDLPWVVT